VLDATTGALQHEIPLADAAPGAGPPGPRSTHPVWAPDSASFYAQDNVHAALVRVDPRGGAVATSLALPSPAHMAYVAPDGTRIYALCVGRADDGSASPSGGRADAGAVPLAEAGPDAGARRPSEAGLGPGAGPPSVAVLDAASGRLLANVPIPLAEGESGELHHGALDAARRRFFVANLGQGRPRGGHSVHVLDTDSLELVARLETGAGAGHPLLSPDGAQLFVVNHSAPRLHVFDADTLALVGEVALPGAKGMGHGCFFANDGRDFWAVSSGTGAAYAVDTRTLQVVAQVETGPNCQDIVHHWRDAYA
jgi:DNA-binding beta-propeller fold protein YncE